MGRLFEGDRMTKLKTLKDMSIVDEIVEPTGIYKEDLQEAAKEWVDTLSSYRWGFSGEHDIAEAHMNDKVKEILHDDFYHIDLLIKWIEYFFNLDGEE